MTTTVRDETSTFRHRVPVCLACGAPLARATTGRRRLFCGAACRQRAYRLRVEHRGRRDAALPADPADVSRLLAATLRHAGRR